MQKQKKLLKHIASFEKLFYSGTHYFKGVGSEIPKISIQVYDRPASELNGQPR
jgi:hypothetical protein